MVLLSLLDAIPTMIYSISDCNVRLFKLVKTLSVELS